MDRTQNDGATPSGSATAGDAGKVGAGKKKKKKGLIRWWVLLTLIIAPIVGIILGKNAIALRVVQSVSRAALGTELAVESTSVSLLGGTISLKGVTGHDPARAEKVYFTADEALLDMDLGSLFRGRVVLDELKLSNPRGKLVRRKDGTIGIGEGEEEQPEGEEGSGDEWRKRREKLEELAKKRDFIEDLKEVVRKVRERLAKRQEEEGKSGEKQEPDGERGEEGGPPRGERAPYVRKDHPAIVVKRLVCDGVEVDVSDEAAEAPPMRIEKARVVVENLSTDPVAYPHPIRIDMDGEIADSGGAKIGLDGELDVTGADLRSSLGLTAQNVPLHMLDALIKGTVPLVLQNGMKGSLTMPLSMESYTIDWRPAIRLDNIKTQLRDPSQRKIAGLDSGSVLRALNEVGSLNINDIRIHGPLDSPKVELGDTLKTVVTEGGKAYAKRKALEEASKAQAKLGGVISKEADKLREKLGEDEKTKGLLDAGEGLLKGATGGAAKDAAEKATGAFGGLFGGKKKDSDK
ncbi:DUF748 domain-containing protein [Planctomycetota bacterium]